MIQLTPLGAFQLPITSSTEDQNLILTVQDHLKCVDMENFVPS